MSNMKFRTVDGDDYESETYAVGSVVVVDRYLNRDGERKLVSNTITTTSGDSSRNQFEHCTFAYALSIILSKLSQADFKAAADFSDAFVRVDHPAYATWENKFRSEDDR